MILLSGHSLTYDRRVPVESHSLSLKERESTATMTPADMGGITTESWFLDDVNPGAGIVWRVKSIQQDYGTKTPVIQLEHIISTLRDKILFGEITPATITGRLGATTCTAQEAVSYILGQQSDWVLDGFDYGSVENAYKFDGDNLYDALGKVCETLNEPWWSYDMSVYPFKLSIKAKSSAVACELRPGRNLAAITKTIDKSGMYTRFYPIGKDDLHVTGNYVSKNESTYGIIAKVEVDQSLTTEAQLTAWANERLNKHAEPAVSITADGLELADATGETLDRLTLGRICRIPLTEFSTTIEERIVELYYRDKAHEPENVRITMANQHEDIVRILAEEIKTGGGRGGSGGRGSARQQKEDHAWFEDTNDHVAMCAIGIIGVDAQGNPNWYRLSQLIVDGEGVHDEIVRVMYDQVEMYSTMLHNEEELRVEFQNNLDSTRSEFQMTSESLRIEFESANQSLRSAINVEAGKISQIVTNVGADGTVTSASIVTAINNTTGQGEVHIDAGHVYINAGASNESDIVTEIGGRVKVSQLDATYINALYSTSGTFQTVGINASGNVVVGGGVMASGLYVGSGSSWTNVSDGIAAVQIPSPTGNTYKLQYKKFSDSSWQDAGTFSRATSLSGEWSGGVFTVTATPQGDTKKTTLTASGHWGDASQSEDPLKYYLPVKATIDNGSTEYSTGTQFIVDAGAKFTPVTLTLQGGQDSVYTEVSSGGTNYYTAGTAITNLRNPGSSATYYDVGNNYTCYKGNGGSFTVQGSSAGSITAIGTAVWFKQHSKTETPTGTWYTYHTSDPGGTTYKRWSAGTTYTNLYNAGTVTKYARGDTYTVTTYNVTLQGTAYGSITPINANSKIMLASTIRYKAGTPVSNTYYTKN